ncbi:MAG: MFS transporter [Candidatus Methylomirabilales bacterium]
MADDASPAPETPGRSNRVKTLVLCSSIHFLHDGCANALYVLFPLIALDLHLSFAQVGSLKTAYSWAMSALQIPASLLAERAGDVLILGGGTALLGLSFIGTALVATYPFLLVLLAGAGGGSGVQHPLASSMVSKAYEVTRQRTALGTYNFSGDLGKVVIPAMIGVLAAGAGWRWGLVALGLLGLTTGGLLGFQPWRRPMSPADGRTPDVAPRRPTGWGIRDRRRFRRLTVIGMLDDSTRTSLLTFLPFVLLRKGMGPGQIGLVLTLLFAGGAAGKFLCGALAERAGIVPMIAGTEVLTGLLILGLLPLSPSAIYLMVPLLGVVLNGTSSVLYGTVAELVTPEGRSRSYALYYTAVLGTGALAPLLYGLLSDLTGLASTFTVIGVMAMAAALLSLLLREPKPLSPHGSAP